MLGPTLVVHSLREFQDLAVRLATGRLQGRPQGVERRRERAGVVIGRIKHELSRDFTQEAGGLFDTASFTRKAEAAYEAMWEVHVKAGGAMHIAVGGSSQGGF